MPLIWLVASYLIGAIPTSYIAGRLGRGIDLREHGSHNLGATNVYRVLGWKYAIPVALIDVAKGLVPVLVLGPLAPGVPYFPLCCGAVAILGHVFSIFVGYKGGKGVATAAGVILGLAPLALPAVLVVWAVIVRTTGYVSLGSIVAAMLFPLADWLFHPARRGLVTVLFDLAIALFIIWKHRANISRLLAGTENRFGRNQAAAPPRA